MSEPFIGQILLFAGNFAPRNWALCDGQLVAINSNQSLFAILGTSYGGDGRTSFGLPDLRGRVPLGTGQGSGLSNRNLGQKGGVEQVALSESEMPAHTHTEGASTLATQLRGSSSPIGNQTSPAPGNVLANLTDVLMYSSEDTPLQAINGPTIGSTVANAGNSQAHENRQPLLALNYIIALVGLFPSRN